MTQRLPPFPSIRAFEAAARHLSFKHAAEELHVTQSAISHQIKALEQYLGVALFHRKPHGVEMTDDGKAYLPLIAGALSRIATASEQLRADNLTGSLVVGMGSAFASRWLVPRLGRFFGSYPSIDLRIATIGPSADFSIAEFEPGKFSCGDIDAAIVFGLGDWPNLEAHKLASSVLFAVCSPQLRHGNAPLEEPADLRHHTLLHYDRAHDWSRWLEMAGVSGVDATRGPRFDDCNVFFQALVDGHGVGLTLSALAAPELKAGRLVRLFDLHMMPQAWYHLVFPKAAANLPKIVAFRDWLLDESLYAAGPIEQAIGGR